jgi:hypothetical protein
MTAALAGLLAGCAGPGESASPSATAAPVETAVVVVNRSQQPISPAIGFEIPACGEVAYDAAAVAVINSRTKAWALGEAPEDWPAPPVGRLDVFISPSKGRWFILVTSTADPQLFYEGVSPGVPGLRAEPKPAGWPACAGQARLG